MTVYVDDSFIPARVGRLNARWCHLFADSQDELHTFAAAIGLKRSWFQPGRPIAGRPSHLWHYDVTESKRQQAIAAGAQPCTWREAVDIIRRRDGRLNPPEAEQVPSGGAIDLMAALRASLGRAKAAREASDDPA